MSINPAPPQYKGADLDPAKGPGLGCFWLQVVLLLIFVVLTPVGVINEWPSLVILVMFAFMIVLLFFVGQTSIFLMRLVTAERRGRRRPLASRTPTVGELEAREQAGSDEAGSPPDESGSPPDESGSPSGESGVPPGESGVPQ